jgi:ATP-binding cassette subfamily B protein
MIPVRAYIRLLFEYLRPLKGRVAFLSVVLAGALTFALVSPQLIRAFLDRAIGGAPSGELIPLALWFIALAIGQQALNVAATYLAEDIGWTATNRMRANLADHVLRLDMGFHKEHTPGELIERIDGDVTALSNFFSAFAIKLVGNSFLIGGILVLLWRENVWVGLGMSVFTAVSLGAMLRLQAWAVPLWKAVRARSAELFGFIGEQLEGTEDIKANGGDRYMIHKVTEIFRAWLPQQVMGRHGFSALWGMSILNWAFGVVLVFWLGSLFFGSGALTIGSVYLIFHYMEMTRHPMEEIRSQMEDFQKAGAGVARVGELFARTSVLDVGGSDPIPGGPLHVAFDAVTFAYDDADDDDVVLDEVSWELARGRVMGVLGRSGSGKSTLARMLTRLYDPIGGAVLFDGVDARTASIDDLRRRVGMVTQDVQLFRATVRDNLTFFDEEIPDDRLLEVLADLGLESWLDSLPHGLDTRLEAGGAGLSAGQGQLLAFTRIFLKDPGLVILDEASSRLDPATEQLIERAVDRLLDRRTGIIIAHRLATVHRADDILILDGGRVVEHGPRADLAADPRSRLSHLLAVGLEEVLA